MPTMIAAKALMPMAMGIIVFALFLIPPISLTPTSHKPHEIRAKSAVPKRNVRNPNKQPEKIPKVLGFMPRNYIFYKKCNPINCYRKVRPTLIKIGF